MGRSEPERWDHRLPITDDRPRPSRADAPRDNRVTDMSLMSLACHCYNADLNSIIYLQERGSLGAQLTITSNTFQILRCSSPHLKRISLIPLPLLAFLNEEVA